MQQRRSNLCILYVAVCGVFPSGFIGYTGVVLSGLVPDVS